MSAPNAHSGLTDAASRLATARARPDERRRFRRMALVVNGRMLDAHGFEHDCRTADISPGDARIAAPASIEAGERIIIYLDGFGRIAGRVVRRCGEDEFALVFETSPMKRERIAETLVWLLNKDREGVEAPAPRTGLARAHMARVELEDGGAIEGEVLDFSLAGMTLRTAAPAPPLGAWVRAGGVFGRVARHVEGGFAIDFEFAASRAPRE